VLSFLYYICLEFINLNKSQYYKIIKNNTQKMHLFLLFLFFTVLENNLLKKEIYKIYKNYYIFLLIFLYLTTLTFNFV